MCRKELSILQTGGITGQMAHIVAHSKNGPRLDPNYAAATLDGYDNLLLLCPSHHTEVDTDAEQWPVERLRRAKRKHEEWVRSALAPQVSRRNSRAATKCLFVVSGPSGAGKDVVINRLIHMLEAHGRSATNLRRFTTRPPRPDELSGTPFTHLTQRDFDKPVTTGEISCVHTSLGYTYGCDSSFASETPAGTAIFYSMRVYDALPMIKREAEACGLNVRNLLLKADEESIRSRVLMRSSTEAEKCSRITKSLNDLNWLATHQDFSGCFFDMTVNNSDTEKLRDVVQALYSFVVGTMEEVAELRQYWEHNNRVDRTQ